MLTEFEQQIYNCYLASSRSSLGKPFTLRKDFSDFKEEHPDYFIIKKLGYFFKKYPQVEMRDFFSAPYQIYNDGEFYYLSFFITRKAISLYTMHMKKLQEQSPDSPEQLASITKSLLFIITFCKDHNITINNYINYKEDSATIEAFLDHYKTQRLNLYVLLSIPNFENKVGSLDEELQGLFFGDLISKFTSFKIKLYQSLKAKSFIESYIKRANFLLNSH